MKDTLSLKCPVKRKHKYADARFGLIFAIIPIVGYCLFGIIPQIISFLISFAELKSVYFEDITWIGLENYKEMITNVTFWKALGNTIFYMLSMVICIIIGLLIAMLLSKENLFGKKIFQTIFFIPYICSLVATSIMWQWIFESDYGILNGILIQIFGETARVRWLTLSWGFRFAIVTMSVWGGYGYNVILYQSAISAVDKNLYEAANLDGAGRWKKFVKITLPSISPTTFYMVTMGMIGAFQAFTTQQIWGGDSGGPSQAGLTVVYYVYNMGIKFTSSYGMGLASAASWMLSIIIFVMTRISYSLSKYWVSE